MDIIEDQVLRKAQRGLLFGKPKFGIFVTALYKKELNVDDPSVHSGILEAVCDVIKYALELEKAEGNGKELFKIPLLNFAEAYKSQKFSNKFRCEGWKGVG